jgi:hypothetical protein
MPESGTLQKMANKFGLPKNENEDTRLFSTKRNEESGYMLWGHPMNYTQEIERRVKFVDQEVNKLVRRSVDNEDGNVTIEEENEHSNGDGEDCDNKVVVLDELEDVEVSSPDKNRSQHLLPQKINKKRLGIFNKEEKTVRESKDKKTSVSVSIATRDIDEKTLKK